MATAKKSPFPQIENTIIAAIGAMQQAVEAFVTTLQTIQTEMTKAKKMVDTAKAQAQEMVDTATKVKDEAQNFKKEVEDDVKNLASKEPKATADTNINIKDEVQNFKKSVKTAVNNLAADGVGETIEDNEPTAAMQEKIEEKYVNSEKKKDVEAQKEFDERNNEEMVHNVSAMYARGLAWRYKLQQEGVDLQTESEEQKDDESIPDVIEKVNTVRMRGAARWIQFMQLKANQLEQDATIQLIVQNATTQPENKETESQ